MGIDPVTAAIGSTLVTGALGYKGAKDQRRAQRAQLEAQMAGFNLAKPFLEDTYSGGQDALNTALDTGTYQGQRFAGLDPYSMDALNYIYGFGSDFRGLPGQMMGDTSGFTQNYTNLYNQATSGQNFDDAMAYATNQTYISRSWIARQETADAHSQKTLCRALMSAHRVPVTQILLVQVSQKL